jgi:hypothetical protein
MNMSGGFRHPYLVTATGPVARVALCREFPDTRGGFGSSSLTPLPSSLFLPVAYSGVWRDTFGHEARWSVRYLENFRIQTG